MLRLDGHHTSLAMLPCKGDALVAEDAVVQPGNFNMVFDVELKNFPRAALQKPNLVIKRQPVDHLPVQIYDLLVSHSSGGNWAELGVVLRYPFARRHEHLHRLALLHLYDDNAVLPVVRLLVELVVPGRDALYLLASRPILTLIF